MIRMVIATRNEGKVREFKRILEDLPVEILTAAEAGVVGEAEETGTTFSENAYLKASYVAKQTGLISIADDSGICVDWLDGAPGVHSARYAGEHGSDEKNNDKLLAALEGVPDEQRGARFECAIACVCPDGTTFTVLGSCPGKVGYQRAGTGGFGYDPLFYVGERSFAEMTPEEKDRISHRGKALRAFEEKFRDYLQQQAATTEPMMSHK